MRTGMRNGSRERRAGRLTPPVKGQKHSVHLHMMGQDEMRWDGIKCGRIRSNNAGWKPLLSLRCLIALPSPGASHGASTLLMPGTHFKTVSDASKSSLCTRVATPCSSLATLSSHPPLHRASALSLAHPLTGSPTQGLTDSLTHSLTHSITHSLSLSESKSPSPSI